MDAKLRIESLREELNRYNHEYYVMNAPSISDYDFDILLRELQDLEKAHPEFADPNSPTQRVGSDITTSFRQVEHIYPMLSLSNTYSEAEVRDFYARVERGLNSKFEVVGELKYDGTSISLIYEDGALVRAVTRGDGVRGDDVTANVRTIRSVPLILKGDFPSLVELRGEILMPWQVFDDLNKERESQEESLFANPRNAASGTLKLQNSAEVAKRRLDCYVYAVLGEGLPYKTHFENLQHAKQWGFKISDAIRCCETIDEVMDYINYWDVERKNLPVATDGIVLKVNNLNQQLNLGYTAKSPRWAIAYKFKAEQALTRLLSVSFQVGRTGAVTPVANLEAVQLSGTVVRRASLHNADFIENLDLHLDDMVYVEKGGEIIPKITAVDLSQRVSTAERVQFIAQCPECGTPLIRQGDEAAFYCPNEDGCPPQIKGRIEHFVSRRAMNIDGLGSETIALLYDKGLVNNIADLYDLKVPELVHLDRLQQKSARNIVQGVSKSIEVPFARVLFALGIRFVGETVAKRLAQAFGSINALIDATFDELIAVDEIGERITISVIDYFKKEEHLALIERLRSAGLQMEQGETLQPKSDSLLGATIVVSGTFAHHSRDEYKQLIEQHGGKLQASVSAKSQYILAGDNMGPAKLEKANKLGVKLLNENEFLAMIGEPISQTLF